jgi:hypothetical protein
LLLAEKMGLTKTADDTQRLLDLLKTSWGQVRIGTINTYMRYTGNDRHILHSLYLLYMHELLYLFRLLQLIYHIRSRIYLRVYDEHFEHLAVVESAGADVH